MYIFSSILQHHFTSTSVQTIEVTFFHLSLTYLDVVELNVTKKNKLSEKDICYFLLYISNTVGATRELSILMDGRTRAHTRTDGRRKANLNDPL